MTDSIKPSSTYRTNVRINTEDVVWPDCSILHESLDELLRQERERFCLYRGDPPEEWVDLCRENPVLGTDEAIKRRIDSPHVESRFDPPPAVPTEDDFVGIYWLPVALFVAWATFVNYSWSAFGPVLTGPLSQMLHELQACGFIVGAIVLLWLLLFLVSVLLPAGFLLWILSGWIRSFFGRASLVVRSLVDGRYGNAWQLEFRRKEMEFVDEALLRSSNMRHGVLEKGKGYYPWWVCPSNSMLIHQAVDDLMGRVAGLDRRIRLLEAMENKWRAPESGAYEKFKRISGLLCQVAQAKEAVESRSLALSEAYRRRLVDSYKGSISSPEDELLRGVLKDSVGSLLVCIESAESFVVQEEHDEYAYGAESARAWRKSRR
jgi:hypothetical protein